MNSLAVTKPYINLILTEDKDTKQLVALVTAICLFIWIHRFTVLTLIENINVAFNLARATWQAYLTLFELLLSQMEFTYLPG